MGNCLVKKLQQSVDDENLKYLGGILLCTTELPSSGGFFLRANAPVKIKLLEGSWADRMPTYGLTDRTDKEVTMIADYADGCCIVPNAGSKVLITNKYALTTINISQNFGLTNPFDLADIKYCTELTKLITHGAVNVIGDIANISNLTKLERMEIQKDRVEVSGDISSFANLTNLTALSISHNKMSGDISAFRNLTKLTFLMCLCKTLSGDISCISNLTGLTYLNLETFNGATITGDIASIAGLTNLKTLYLVNSQVYGDFNNLPYKDSLTNCRLPVTVDNRPNS